jgi:uncharacterized protein YndB with AHSA1/START domain
VPAKVYKAITEQEEVVKWWNKETIAKPEIGFVNIFMADGEVHTKLKVTDLVPEKTVRMECIDSIDEWVGTKIYFDLNDLEGYTGLCFSHVGWKAETILFVACKEDWLFYLNSLKAFCETGEGTPFG